MKPKVLKKSISITEKRYGMAEELMLDDGYVSFSELISVSIMQMHRKRFPSYGGGSTIKKQIREQKKEQTKESVELEAATDFCTRLDGKIIDIDGQKYCEYDTYNRDVIYEQVIAIESLGEYLIENQYAPDRKTVEELLAKKNEDGKTE